MSALTGSRKTRRHIPAHPFSLLSHEIDDLINRFGENWAQHWRMNPHVPLLDLSESQGALEAKLDVPGVSPDDIEIQVSGDTLTICGRHREEEIDDSTDKRYHRAERRSGSFRRTVSLPCTVRGSDVTAEYQDGVLTITLPKSEGSRSTGVAVIAK